jgi:hypothetical protein
MKTYYKNYKLSDSVLLNFLVEKETNTTIPYESTDYTTILEEVKIGEAEIVEWVEPEPHKESWTWESIKSVRDKLLSKTDWTVSVDATPKPSKQAWLDYRQALRDIPQKFSNPNEVVWPTKP